MRGIVLIDDTHTTQGKINIDAVKNLIQNEIRTLVNRHKDWFEGLEENAVKAFHKEIERNRKNKEI